MGDLTTLEKARRELEELYLGIPDESVNLTFQDFADVKQQHVLSSEEKRSQMDPISEINSKSERSPSPLTKFSSPHTTRGSLEQPTHHHHHHVTDDDANPLRGNHHHHHHHHHHDAIVDNGSQGHRYTQHRSDHASPYSPRRDVGFGHAVESSMAYNDVSVMSNASMSPFPERGGRRRQGIPHSNICTICSVYIYIFGHRCLVCGRVYCRTCVNLGMGEMTEGRKCTECLGRRFSQRYIQRAGRIGCCTRYPRMVKQQELKWAEKGPRRSGERGYNGRSAVMSRSRSPIAPRTPTRPHPHAHAHAHAHATTNPPSFVMNSPYSDYSPTNHPLPF